jgi:hypothetical protein
MFKSFLIMSFFIFSIPKENVKQSSNNDVFCFACAECNKVIYFEQIGTDYWPNSYGCDVDVWHSWCNIGIYGNIKSQCKYCKIVVKTKFNPLGCVQTRKSCSGSKKQHAFVKI